MRALIYQALMSNAALAAVGMLGRRVYQQGSLGIGDIPAEPERPYLLIGELPSVPYREVRMVQYKDGTGRPVARHFQLWAYDDRGDMDRIDSILALARETVLGLVGQTSPTGAFCAGSEWLGNSQDLDDAERDYQFKFATFKLTTNQ